MKKLMMAVVAAIATVGAANAGTMASKMYFEFQNDADLWTHHHVYLIKTADFKESSVNVIAAAVERGDAAYVVLNNPYSDEDHDGEVYQYGRVGDITANGLSASTVGEYSLIISDYVLGAELTNQTYYQVTPYLSNEILAYDTDQHGNGPLKLADRTSLTDAPAPIPEPTSGLLMLIGMAGLALKRKRA